MIIGACKSATTTFAADLSNSTQFVVPEVKEPHFLCYDCNARTLEAKYGDIYGDNTKATFRVDASTGYAKQHEFPDVATVAKDVLSPHTHIVFLVRDPIKRAISHHFHLSRRSGIPKDFGKACTQDPGIIECGKYYSQLEPWIKTFDAQHLHVFVMEDYVKNRLSTINGFLKKIGADELASVQSDQTFNSGESKNSARFGLGMLTHRIMCSPVYKRMMRPLLGGGLRKRIKNALMTTSDQPPVPSADDIASVIAECESDWQRFFEWYGETPPSWTMGKDDETVFYDSENTAGGTVSS